MHNEIDFIRITVKAMTQIMGCPSASLGFSISLHRTYSLGSVRYRRSAHIAPQYQALVDLRQISGTEVSKSFIRAFFAIEMKS